MLLGAICLFSMFLVISGTTVAAANQNDRRWHAIPAEKLEHALPVGNGHLEGMGFGQPDLERIQINEDKLYALEPEIEGCLPDIRPSMLQRLTR